MDPAAEELKRPVSTPTSLTPWPSSLDALEQQHWTQQLLENWMEHFDRRLDELVASHKQEALSHPHVLFQEANKSSMTSLTTRLTKSTEQGSDSKVSNKEQENESKVLSSKRVSTQSCASIYMEKSSDEEQRSSPSPTVRFETQESVLSQFLKETEVEHRNSAKAPADGSRSRKLTKSAALQARQSMQVRISELYNNLANNKRGVHYHGVSRIVHSQLFENCISFVIIVNGIVIGAQVELEAREGEGDHLFFSVAEGVFFAIFFIELVLRVIGLGSEWISSVWNVFDALLVMLQLVEFIVKLFGGNANAKGTATGRIMRVFRIARIVRVVRLLRFFVQLRVMVKMIMYSLESLFWLMVLLIVMMYVVAIIFTQGVTDYVNTEDSDLTRARFLRKQFGDIPTSSLSLFKAITNGVGWGAISDELFGVNPFFGVVFVIFVFFVFFSVLNVVTGVFVDGAIQHAGQERELLVAAERKSLEGMCSKLMELLVDMDTDSSGTITLDELLMCAKDPILSSYFSALEIHTPETALLFSYLDRDGNGEIDLQEFVDGCLSIRGGARNIDLHMLLFKLEREQTILRERLVAAFNALDQEVSCIHRHVSGAHSDILHLLTSSGQLTDQQLGEVIPSQMIPSDWHMGRMVALSPTMQVSTPRVSTPRVSPRTPRI